MPICVILGIDKNDVGWVETIGRKRSLAKDMKAD
tara:strand:- start:429 stop:530 length:102 start_codon:yes stop_codon:yes gene_type:complete